MIRIGISAAIASDFPVQPDFWAPLKTDLLVHRGIGSPTFTRATTATVTDHEGLLKTAIAGEARFKGARRVRNYLPTSENFAAASWTKEVGVTITSGILAPDGTTTASTMTQTTTANNKLVTTVAGIPNSSTIVNSTFIRRRTGTGSVFILDRAANPIEFTSIISTEWKRIAVNPGLSIGDVYFGFQLGTVGDAIDIWHPQLEDATGQSNQNPAEYVSVGVLSPPWHGANVDGVKYFPWLNGNTVASNVVIEAQGAPISDATLQGYLSEGARTQYLGVTAAPATQTTASLGTGTYCLWCVGGTSVTSSAGTATITGAGAAVPGTPNVFTVTVAGTVTVTVSGAVTFFQLENGAFPSSRIDNSGAAGTSVTRNAEIDSLSTAGNIVAAQGSLYMEITPQHAPSGTVSFWGTYVDASNYTVLLHDGTNLIFRKRIAATNYDATIAWAFVSGTTAKIAASWGALGSTIYLDGVAGTPHANTTAAQIAATMQVGADGNSLQQPFANLKNDRVWLTQLPAAIQGAITK